MLALRPSNVFRDDLGRPLTTHVALCYRRLTMKPATQDRCCPPANERADLRPIEGDEADEELANMSKALGHPARVKIMSLLFNADQDGLNGGELAAATGSWRAACA